MRNYEGDGTKQADESVLGVSDVHRCGDANYPMGAEQGRYGFVKFSPDDAGARNDDVGAHARVPNREEADN